MKKKFLSILLCLCMVMALLPTTAFATDTAPELIKVGGIELTDGKYLAANDAPILEVTVTLPCIRTEFCI